MGFQVGNEVEFISKEVEDEQLIPGINRSPTYTVTEVNSRGGVRIAITAGGVNGVVNRYEWWISPNSVRLVKKELTEDINYITLEE